MEEMLLFLRRFFRRKKVRRMAVEIMISLAVGILAGIITFNVLAKKDRGLSVSQENAVAIIDKDAVVSEDDGEDQEPAEEEDFSDVVITVVESGAYAKDVENWSAAQVDAAVSERTSYLANNKYWPTVSDYWTNVRGVTDNSCYCRYLFSTDTKVYTAADFADVPAEVIHVAKNEIYARHGYSFRDTEIMNYFMGQVWYSPTVMPSDFSEEVFSETEVKNLDLLNSIDKM